jgi:hypothetical protein
MRIGFGMRQALKRKNVPLGMLRAIEDQLNASFSQVGDRHLSFSLLKAAMNTPRLYKLRKDCLTGIGQGTTVFVAALPILNEI